MANRKSGGCVCCGGGGPGGPINISGCFCQGTPLHLTLTLTFGPGENTHTYANAYQPCTMTYYTVSGGPPPYMPSSAFPGDGYFSDTAWTDDFGYLDYFRIGCAGTQYSLGIGQFAFGVWQSPGQIYNWAMGSKVPVNFCNPFGLLVGQTQSGIFFNGKFFAS